MTINQYRAFERKYYNTELIGQRFGQAFCNEFNITNPELFYCTDESKAKAIIFETYIK